MMNLITALAAVLALSSLVLALAGVLRWRGLLTPALLALVIALPLLDQLLRTLGLPLSLPGLGLLALPAALWWGVQAPTRLPWRALGAFLTVCLGFLLLRGLAPGFDSFGENIFSLRYVQSLRLAEVYPAPDLWEASPTVATYYTAVHNLPALLSRLFLLPVPLAISLAIALILATIWMALFEAYALRGGRLAAALGATAVLLAGSGVSILLMSSHLPAESMMHGWAHVRLFGMPPAELKTPLLAQLAASNPDLPLESPLHPAIFLGDLHPPLWTFVLVAGLVFAIAQRRTPGGEARLAAALALLPLLVWAGNPWMLPHLGLLAAGLLLLDPGLRRQWRVAGLAAAAGWLLLSPLVLAADYRSGMVSVAWLPAVGRATPLAWLVVWWPVLLLMLGAALRRDRGIGLLLVGVLLLVLSMEVVLFSQGDTQSAFARFNGTLKVWSTLHLLALGLGVLALMGLQGRSRWLWLLALPLLVSSAVHGRDVIRSQINKQQPRFDWSGAGKLIAGREDRAMNLMRLAARPQGRTMERMGRSAYDLAPLTSMLAGHRTVSGWAHHAAQSSGDGAREQRRFERIRDWYENAAEDALALPQEWDINTILLDWDAGWRAERLAVVQAALAPEYVFLPGHEAGDGRVSGLFIRKAVP
jgi:uncharacterized membrane protein